jgi:hypothetical protein
VTSRQERLGGEERRALKILADAGLHGCTGATLFSHGFRADMVADLVRAGLVTAHRETMKVGKRTFGVARVRITDAGRRALDGPT